MRKNFVHYLPYCGVMTAATFIFTMINITIPLGSRWLVHLGAAMAVAIVFILPPLYASISVALGMALYDLLGGWAIWSPFTLVIRFSQVLVLSIFITKEKHRTINAIIGFLLAALIDVGGYYLAEVIIYGNWIAALEVIPAEIILNIVGIAVGLPAGLLFKRIRLNKELNK